MKELSKKSSLVGALVTMPVGTYCIFGKKAVGYLALLMHCGIHWIWFSLSKSFRELLWSASAFGSQLVCGVHLAGSGDCECGRHCCAVQLCLCQLAMGHLCFKFLQERSHLWGRDEDRRNSSLDRRHQCGKLVGESTPYCDVKQL